LINPTFTSTEFYIVECDKTKILPRFLFSLIFTDFFFNQFADKTTGSTGRRRLDRKIFENLQIPLPPLQTQQKLVAMMDKAYQTKKEKEQKAKELLDSIDDFVMGELGIEKVESVEKKVFGAKLSTLGRFDVEYNLPKNKKLMDGLKNSRFEYQSIKKVSDFISGYAFKSSDYVDSGIPLIRIQDINEKVSPFDSSKHLPLNYAETYNKFLVKENDLLISMTGGIEGEGRVGKIALVKENKLGLLNQRCGIIRAKSNINTNYLFTFLNTNIFRTLLVNEAVISVQVNVSESDITNLPIPLPPIQTQQKIADEVEKRRSEAFGLQLEAKEVLEKAKAEFEREVLGLN
jgi:type I restriction enzyme, S subunit